MAARKLQQEIDKTFKKVDEGVAVFEGIYEKLQASTNQSQKEKLEDSLKKEIKKLQKSRDQIKQWATQSDVKDKTPLQDKRKLIETQMERFKAVEKEMKTKAYSKEGLSAAAKLSPEEQEKQDTTEFIATQIAELEVQIEAQESEVQTLQSGLKKGKKGDSTKAERVAELERKTEQHRWHQGRLELLLRALENGNVEVSQVKEIEDGIKYYVENNSEVDFMDDDTIYDDLNLDEEGDIYGLNNDNDRVSSQDAQSIQDEGPDHDEKPKPPPAIQKTKSTEAPAAQARRPSVQLKSPLPALATLHTAPITNTVPASTSGMKPAPLPTIPTGQPLKYASAAAAAAASDKAGVGIAPLPPPPSQPAAKTSTSNSPSTAPSQPATVAPSPQQVPPARPVKAVEQTTPTAPTEPSPAPAPVKPVEVKAAPPVETVTSTIEPPPGLSHTNGTTPLTNAGAAKNESEEPESVWHLPSSLQDVLGSFQAAKARNAANNPADERMLAASRAQCPSPLDAERPNHYKPQSPFAYTPAHYPQEPLQIFDDARLYSRIDTDTLFYAFYYRQGTYQQYLAAKALKSQSWRFHKQYQTWFQRHEEPKNITEEYEQGTYRFFDYESTWMNRRKADFKFAYKFLEDDL
ncbi:hypothetical protein CAC42_4040 [Sphaceloma murrayae]|uniref:General negative regulator of transcription subunit n=1 Tax=Sphaceloma murrayae TaxID=2082308 RepID=A0A2K1QSR1_9PEZI|nr:hypothetical protein CAC42_4040 [Sphaceloma murrayae]